MNAHNFESVAVDDVVQIDPAHDDIFGGCFLLVTEKKSWGVQGFVHIPGGGDAYYRCPFDCLEYIGPAAWIHAATPEEIVSHNAPAPDPPEGVDPK